MSRGCGDGCEAAAFVNGLAELLRIVTVIKKNSLIFFAGVLK